MRFTRFIIYSHTKIMLGDREVTKGGPLGLALPFPEVTRIMPAGGDEGRAEPKEARLTGGEVLQSYIERAEDSAAAGDSSKTPTLQRNRKRDCQNTADRPTLQEARRMWSFDNVLSDCQS